MKEIWIQTRLSFLFVIIFTILTGFFYPSLVTVVGKVFFPQQAAGSFIEVHGQKIGSELIGQPFDDMKYFWSRPSATTPMAYNAASSSGSNGGPTNPDFIHAVKSRIAALRKADPENTRPIPMDLVTASGSGLDPDISPAAAEYQANRVAKERHMEVKRIKELIKKNTTAPWLGFWGDPVVNVLKLNLALDAAR